MIIREDLPARRAEILAVARRYGAHNVRMFGSVARGEHREDSDPASKRRRFRYERRPSSTLGYFRSVRNDSEVHAGIGN